MGWCCCDEEETEVVCGYDYPLPQRYRITLGGVTTTDLTQLGRNWGGAAQPSSEVWIDVVNTDRLYNGAHGYCYPSDFRYEGDHQPCSNADCESMHEAVTVERTAGTSCTWTYREIEWVDTRVDISTGDNMQVDTGLATCANSIRADERPNMGFTYGGPFGEIDFGGLDDCLLPHASEDRLYIGNATYAVLGILATRVIVRWMRAPLYLHVRMDSLQPSRYQNARLCSVPVIKSQFEMPFASFDPLDQNTFTTVTPPSVENAIITPQQAAEDLGLLPRTIGSVTYVSTTTALQSGYELCEASSAIVTPLEA